MLEISVENREAILQWFNAIRPEFSVTAFKDLSAKHFYSLSQLIKQDTAKSLSPDSTEVDALQTYEFVEKTVNEFFKMESSCSINYESCLNGNEFELSKLAIVLLALVVNIMLERDSEKLKSMFTLDICVQERIKTFMSAVLSLDCHLSANFADNLLCSSDGDKQPLVADNQEFSNFETPKMTKRPKLQSFSYETPLRNFRNAPSPLKAFFDSPQIQNKIVVEKLRKEVSRLSLTLNVEKDKAEDLQRDLNELREIVHAKDLELQQSKGKLSELRKYESLGEEYMIYKRETEAKLKDDSKDAVCQNCVQLKDLVRSLKDEVLKFDTYYCEKEQVVANIREERDNLERSYEKISSDFIAMTNRNSENEVAILQYCKDLQSKNSYIEFLERKASELQAEIRKSYSPKTPNVKTFESMDVVTNIMKQEKIDELEELLNERNMELQNLVEERLVWVEKLTVVSQVAETVSIGMVTDELQVAETVSIGTVTDELQVAETVSIGTVTDELQVAEVVSVGMETDELELVDTSALTDEPQLVDTSALTDEPQIAETVSVGIETDEPQLVDTSALTDDPQVPKSVSICMLTDQPHTSALTDEPQIAETVSICTSTDEPHVLETVSIGTSTDEPQVPETVSIGTLTDELQVAETVSVGMETDELQVVDTSALTDEPQVAVTVSIGTLTNELQLVDTSAMTDETVLIGMLTDELQVAETVSIGMLTDELQVAETVTIGTVTDKTEVQRTEKDQELDKMYITYKVSFDLEKPNTKSLPTFESLEVENSNLAARIEEYERQLSLLNQERSVAEKDYLKNVQDTKRAIEDLQKKIQVCEAKAEMIQIKYDNTLIQLQTEKTKHSETEKKYNIERRQTQSAKLEIQKLKQQKENESEKQKQDRKIFLEKYVEDSTKQEAKLKETMKIAETLKMKYAKAKELYAQSQREIEDVKLKYDRLMKTHQESTTANKEEKEMLYKELTEAKKCIQAKTELTEQVRQASLAPFHNKVKELEQTATVRKAENNALQTRLKLAQKEIEDLKEARKVRKAEFQHTLAPNKSFLPSPKLSSTQIVEEREFSEKSTFLRPTSRTNIPEASASRRESYLPGNSISHKQWSPSTSRFDKSFVSGGYMVCDGEEDFFNHTSLSRIMSSPLPLENTGDRLKELRRRNTLVPQHLKSSYPAETQVQPPASFRENELKKSPTPSKSAMQLPTNSKKRNFFEKITLSAKKMRGNKENQANNSKVTQKLSKQFQNISRTSNYSPVKAMKGQERNVKKSPDKRRKFF